MKEKKYIEGVIPSESQDNKQADALQETEFDIS